MRLSVILIAMEQKKAKKVGKSAQKIGSDTLEKIKRLAAVAMVSDDDLLDQLVLKGGNAMDLVHRIGSRASVDLDFSMKGDFDQLKTQGKVEGALVRTFELDGYLAFDIKMQARPGKMPDELAAFWGGYEVEFKLIAQDRAREAQHDLDVMRREAIQLGEGPKFTIDISCYEYTEGKQEAELEGFRIYVYSPEMIVCEKLRALCQQMPEYGPIIQRQKPGHQRARDFIDIEALVRIFNIDLSSDRAQHMVQEMFALKKVPLTFLSRIKETGSFHGTGYDEVRATIKAGVKLEPWDFYVNFIISQVNKLEPLWHK